jgi:hypothetical protein
VFWYDNFSHVLILNFSQSEVSTIFFLDFEWNVYIINKIIHGRLEIWIYLLVFKLDISLVRYQAWTLKDKFHISMCQCIIFYFSFSYSCLANTPDISAEHQCQALPISPSLTESLSELSFACILYSIKTDNDTMNPNLDVLHCLFNDVMQLLTVQPCLLQKLLDIVLSNTSGRKPLFSNKLNVTTVHIIYSCFYVVSKSAWMWLMGCHGYSEGVGPVQRALVLVTTQPQVHLLVMNVMIVKL